MKIQTPRLVNLARAISGAQSGGEDGLWVVRADQMRAVISLTDPLRPENMNVAPPAAGQVYEDSFSSQLTLVLSGVNGAQNVNLGDAAPGMWRLSLFEEFCFTGTSNAAAGMCASVHFQNLSAAKEFRLTTHAFITETVPRTTVRTLDIALNERMHFEAFTTTAMVAGDLLQWTGTLLMQRLF